MNSILQKQRTSWIPLLIIVVTLSLFSYYIINGLRQSSTQYTAVQSELDKPVYRGNLVAAELPGYDRTINITDWTVFSDDGIWSLISAARSLQPDFTPTELTMLTLQHGDGHIPMQIQPVIADPLSQLFLAADSEGHPLMVSSAYRSLDDQEKIYAQFSERLGPDAVRQYVAKPGSSEHHSGLAVDLSDASDACKTDSNACNLSPETTAWLTKNAPSYGFILRYPEGSHPQTGIAFEPWHYRFVGIPLALAVSQSGLTLDEVLVQLRPAFAR